MSRNRSILKPLNIVEAQVEVKVKATYYRSFARLYFPKDTYTKRIKGLEGRASLKAQSSGGIGKNETDIERSLRRSRKAIKDYVFSNTFDLFCTFTFRADRKNDERSRTKMGNWLKNQRARTGKFDYIIVPEFHADKQALHFHSLIKNYKGKIVRAVNPKTGRKVVDKYTKKPIYRFPGYRSGFSHIRLIDQTEESATKIGFYLQKYITKDMPIFHGKNRYWASRGLRKPTVINNPEPWYEYVPHDRMYVTDFGVILEYDKGKHPLTDMFIETYRK